MVMKQRKKQNNRKLGSYYEQAAGYYLEQQGFCILQFNYRCYYGEIDIIAIDGQCLVFCEVKYRQNENKGSPLAAVNEKKQRKLYQCAGYYLTVHSIKETACRFDVIGIEGSRVMHIKDAFQVL
jgi:putative endonuclease